MALIPWHSIQRFNVLEFSDGWTGSLLGGKSIASGMPLGHLYLLGFSLHSALNPDQDGVILESSARFWLRNWVVKS